MACSRHRRHCCCNNGALGNIPPFQLCGTAEFPFYNGPCGCVPGEVEKPGFCPRDADLSGFQSAMFQASAPLTLAAGAVVPLTPAQGNPEYYPSRRGEICLRTGGFLYVIYTVNVPCGQCVDTVLRLEIDGEEVPGSSVRLFNVNDCGSRSFVGQAMFAAEQGSILRLVTENALNISGDSDPPVVKLTIIRLA